MSDNFGMIFTILIAIIILVYIIFMFIIIIGGNRAEKNYLEDLIKTANDRKDFYDAVYHWFPKYYDTYTFLIGDYIKKKYRSYGSSTWTATYCIVFNEENNTLCFVYLEWDGKQLIMNKVVPFDHKEKILYPSFNSKGIELNVRSRHEKNPYYFQEKITIKRAHLSVFRNGYIRQLGFHQETEVDKFCSFMIKYAKLNNIPVPNAPEMVLQHSGTVQKKMTE